MMKTSVMMITRKDIIESNDENIEISTIWMFTYNSLMIIQLVIWYWQFILWMEEKNEENEIRIYNNLPESKSMNFHFHLTYPNRSLYVVEG